MFSRYSVKKPLTVVLAALMVVLLGVISFTKMRTDLLPEMDLPYVAVVTVYAGASPEKVETGVTKPLERGHQYLTGEHQHGDLRVRIRHQHGSGRYRYE